MLIIINIIKANNFYIPDTFVRALDKLIYLILKMNLGGRYYYYIQFTGDKTWITVRLSNFPPIIYNLLGAVLSNMVAMSHMCLFKLPLIKI